MRTVLWSILLATCLLPTVARATTAEQRCQIAKLRAIGAEFQAKLLCEARGLSTGPDEACLAAASARRDGAFRRAEQPGGCTTVGDSQSAGSLVAFRVQNLMTEQRPVGPAPSRCTQHRLLVAGRAATRLTAIFAYAAIVENEDRLLAQLARARSYAEAVYQRAGSFGDCLYEYPAHQFYDNLAGAVGALRDLACPSCGLLCPCWTTAELDQRFPPGSFATKGGLSCKLEQLGYIVGVTSADGCVDRSHLGGTAFSRSGFVMSQGEFCYLMAGDLDPDDDGTCDGTAYVQRVTPEQGKVCIADMLATQVARRECSHPDRPADQIR